MWHIRPLFRLGAVPVAVTATETVYLSVSAAMKRCPSTNSVKKALSNVQQ